MQQNQLRQYWGWQGDCQQYRGRWRRGRSHHFEKFPLLLRHLLWKGPLDGQPVDIGWGCSCCKHSNWKPNEMHMPFSKCELKSHICFLLLKSLFGFHQSALGFRIQQFRTDVNLEHTYLARRSTMIMKVVPLGWGLSIAHRLGWPLRLPQTWVTRARNFW